MQFQPTKGNFPIDASDSNTSVIDRNLGCTVTKVFLVEFFNERNTTIEYLFSSDN